MSQAADALRRIVNFGQADSSCGSFGLPAAIGSAPWLRQTPDGRLAGSRLVAIFIGLTLLAAGPKSGIWFGIVSSDGKFDNRDCANHQLIIIT